MKVGDLIICSMKVENHITPTSGFRIILEEYREGNGFRLFKMLSSKGNIVEWSADNIERYWRVVE